MIGAADQARPRSLLALAPTGVSRPAQGRITPRDTFTTPTSERARLVVAWVRDDYGQAVLDEVQALSLDELRSGMLDPWTEPLQLDGASDGLAP
jgi:hypothetical protein